LLTFVPQIDQVPQVFPLGQVDPIGQLTQVDPAVQEDLGHHHSPVCQVDLKGLVVLAVLDGLAVRVGLLGLKRTEKVLIGKKNEILNIINSFHKLIHT
jgi:hypothetical protein